MHYVKFERNQVINNLVRVSHKCKQIGSTFGEHLSEHSSQKTTFSNLGTRLVKLMHIEGLTKLWCHQAVSISVAIFVRVYGTNQFSNLLKQKINKSNANMKLG